MYKDKSYTSSPIIFVPVLLFTVVMFFFISSISQQKNDNYATLTESTKATVTYYKIDKVRSKGGAYNYYHDVKFEYIVNKKKYTVTDTYQGPENKIASVGEKIDIHYNPKNPNNAIPDKFMDFEKDKNDSVKGYFIILIIVILLLAFYSFSHNKNKKKIQY